MRKTKLPEAELIDTPEALERLVKELKGKDIVAVDTESNSLYAYREQVCLIQFSTTEKDYLVDALALEDLSPLGELFEDEEIEKVFHAAEYDLICLKRDYGFRFENLFDTMVAATVLGKDNVGLGAILENQFGVELNKKFQRADWGQRPLSREMLSYAQLDTHFLINLRDRLEAELAETDRLALAEEDFERLRQVSARTPENADKTLEEVCWRIRGATELSPRQAAVLLELCRYRDEEAMRLDRPLFKVLSDATLHAVASSLPATEQELKRLPGMSLGQVRRHGEGLLAAVQRGLGGKPAYPPRHRRPDEEYLNRVEALRQWRKTKAREMGVKSDVVLAKDLMMAVAAANPGTMEELREVLGEAPYRVERFGGEILGVLGENHR